MNTFLLIAAALLPAIILCIYVYKKDSVEKEPVGLLLKLLFAGIIIIIPVVFAEFAVGGVIDRLFGVFEDDTSHLGFISVRLYHLLTAFIGVAIIEEFFKWGALHLLTRKNKNFNSLFDGLIYAIFVSLGFAALENVLYVISNGFGNAVMRAVMSVPGHMFFGVMMGYYYSITHMTIKAQELEAKFMQCGAIPAGNSKFSTKYSSLLSLIVPTVMHGLYDYCCFNGTIAEILLLIAFIVAMYIYCFSTIKKVSAEDVSDNVYSTKMVIKKYPQLHTFASENPELYNSIIS
ncbi:MAG: PrsW family intramembrane metalloprotease [Clostridia bacterium]|nr:PrsW family intramembrane metalloprotease [Clostridia bacterium]